MRYGHVGGWDGRYGVQAKEEREMKRSEEQPLCALRPQQRELEQVHMQTIRADQHLATTPSKDRGWAG